MVSLTCTAAFEAVGQANDSSTKTAFNEATMPDEEDVAAHDVRRLGLTRLQKLACGPGHPELSKSYMDMASKLFTFTFTTC